MRAKRRTVAIPGQLAKTDLPFWSESFRFAMCPALAAAERGPLRQVQIVPACVGTGDGAPGRAGRGGRRGQEL